MRSRAARTLAPFVATGLFVSALAAALSLASTAGDGNDTRGVLDVRTVRFRDVAGAPPEWTVITFSRWSAPALWDRGYVYVEVDTLGGPDGEYLAMIRSDGRQMVGHLFRLGKGPSGRDTLISSLRVRKPAPRVVTVRVPLRKLRFGERRAFYRWWVMTALSTDRCPAVCFDRIPDDGSMLEYRPGMSPTPSPTGSPSPSESASPDPS